MSTLAERLRTAREYLAAHLEKPVSQRGLAEICGWNNGQSRVGNYEAGNRTPSPENTLRLARATGVRVEWLVYGLGYMSDDHAAMALKIDGATGEIHEERQPIAASDGLKQLILKMTKLENKGILDPAMVKALTAFLESYRADKEALSRKPSGK